jgi:type IV secretion system protein VirD4
MSGWGPTDQTERRSARGLVRNWRWFLRAVVVFLAYAYTVDESHSPGATLIAGWAITVLLALLALPASTQRHLISAVRRRAGLPVAVPVPVRKQKSPTVDPLMAIRRQALTAGAGVYLGVTDRRAPRFGRAERAVLVLGPPRAGKTSSVIIPALISHTGPAVSTSTKSDVAAATVGVRSGDGQAWVFDPTGQDTGQVNGTVELRWSPVTSSLTWDGALLTARAMTVKVGAGATDRSHWASRSQALLAPLLHAAAVHGRDMDVVVDWVMRHDIDAAGVLLEDKRCSKLAFGSLLGILNTEDRERSSIFSATADALEAYTSENALSAARDPNFNADAFVRSADTLYIHAPAEAQAAAAPIVCGLLSEIRRATYRAHGSGQLASGRMLFALDEAANIAPLDELPQIASEGGGQGLILLAAFQDLSQARQRWGAQADGFLTLFGTNLILPGVADTRTLDAVSQMLGEYDRTVVSETKPKSNLLMGLLDTGPVPSTTTTRSTQRTRVLSVGEVANLPAGHGLHLDGVSWELLTLTPAHSSEPWRSLISHPA